MDNYEFYHLMQICGGTFPTGAFSQSWGLESYVSKGIITDSDGFKSFLKSYLISNIGKCEGPLAAEAYRLAGEYRTEEIVKLEQLSNAMKTTFESRQAGLKMGKAFARIISPMLEDDNIRNMIEGSTRIAISYPVVYGLACRALDIKIENAIKAYTFSTANALLQSATKLIPLGNTEAQLAIFHSNEVIDKTVELSLATNIDQITNFCPGIDIASAEHENLPVRLYMS